jgi:hypothetical protein
MAEAAVGVDMKNTWERGAEKILTIYGEILGA